MRVLVVTTWLPTTSHPSIGSFVLKDAQAIADLGHEVAIVHLVPPSQLGANRAVGIAQEAPAVQGLPVTRIAMSTTSPRQIAAAGHRLSRLSAGADVVHSMAFSSLLAMAWWRPSAPWVHTEHWSGLTAPHLLPKAWQWALPGLTRLLAKPDVVTAVCDYLAAPIREVRGAAPTVVVPCIVPRPPDLVPRRPLHDTIRMVSVGGLIERKDPLMAVEVVAELGRRGRPATLRLVGDGPLAGQITARARQLGVQDQVTLVGTLDRTGVLQELADADLFLGPTLGDNFFVSCAEAVLAGRPVVVGSTGGQGEYLDERVGVCVDEQSPQAYAEAIDRVLARAEGMSAGDISDTLGEDFAASEVAMGYQRAYDRAAAQRRQRGHQGRRWQR
ncbi:MAG: glycosyltransferase family 4 protein [Ornithinimicrobium sp.]